MIIKLISLKHLTQLRDMTDHLNIDNSNFEGMVNQIHPSELRLNKAYVSDTEVPFFINVLFIQDS